MKRWDFRTLSEFVGACNGLSVSAKDSHNSKDWTGETWKESIGYASRGGTDASLSQAEALISKIQAELPETITRRWALDMVGAFPSVPAYLAGEPENMWALTDMPTESAPVRIFISSTSSGGVKHSQLFNRGCACLALVLIASRTRTIELYSYAHCAETDSRAGDAVIVQRLQSAPMMLSEIAYVLTSPGFARNLTYAFLSDRLKYDNLHWGKAAEKDNYQGGPATRRLLGLADTDVLIGPAHSEDPAVKTPIEFVQRELSKLGLSGE